MTNYRFNRLLTLILAILGPIIAPIVYAAFTIRELIGDIPFLHREFKAAIIWALEPVFALYNRLVAGLRLAGRRLAVRTIAFVMLLFGPLILLYDIIRQADWDDFGEDLRYWYVDGFDVLRQGQF